jgi:hypothetical protein
MQEYRGPGNTISILLDESFDSQMRVNVKADGSIETTCADEAGHDHHHGKAARTTSAPVAAKNQTPGKTKGSTDDR